MGPSEDVELPLKKVVDLLEEFEEMQGLRLLVTGGEPLLHRDFKGINDALSDYAFRKVLFTNGTLLSEKVVRNLHVDEIQISIDGLEPGHDALRGGGTFRRAMNAIETARGMGMDVSVSTMVHSKNLQDFDAMEYLFKEMGIKDWSVDVPCVEGNLKNNALFQVRPEIAGRYLGYGFGEGLHGGGQGFACGLHLVSVMADGKVARCSFYSGRPVGTADEGLHVCWRRIVPQRIEELACDCSVKDVCRGGCRFRAELIGNSHGKDICRCYAYGMNP
jgi:radical SAM protein with 4Fe4S-binding SPASM domain